MFCCLRNIDALLDAWLRGTEQQAEDGFNQFVNWSPEAAQALQESVLGGNVGGFCLTDNNVSVINYYTG